MLEISDVNVIPLVVLTNLIVPPHTLLLFPLYSGCFQSSSTKQEYSSRETWKCKKEATAKQVKLASLNFLVCIQLVIYTYKIYNSS